MYVIEYWPNYVDRDESTRKVTQINSLDDLPNVSWLNKSGHGWRVDGKFIRQKDDPWIIAILSDVLTAAN
jgi:hypothetical protein